MHKLARQKHILDRLSETGQLSISELVAELQVSADTIRRDLSDLEQQGVLQKSHGGAIALNVPAMTRQGGKASPPQTQHRPGQREGARIARQRIVRILEPPAGKRQAAQEAEAADRVANETVSLQVTVPLCFRNGFSR